MCMVSLVMEYHNPAKTYIVPTTWQLPNPVPNWQPQFTTPLVEPIAIPTPLTPPPFNFDQYVAYSELLRKATEYDKIMNEPNCHDPKKMEFLKLLMTRMDELGEEFRQISLEIKSLFDEETN